jgi:outer membrane protein assembly factor BamB
MRFHVRLCADTHHTHTLFPSPFPLPRFPPPSQRYGNPEARAHLPADVSLSNYLATGLVVFDLGRMSLKWSVHLDLSTDAASYKAYAYSSPTAADADGDGSLEIYVGTSVGFVYAFAPTGVLRPGYPVQLGEVQAGVSLADLDGDGSLELLVADTRGNVASLDAATGREKWERHLASMAAQSATFADVNADGVLDVILPTADGRVHVLHGVTGADVQHFPFATGARIMAPVTPVPSPPGAPASMPPVTLIAASFDGFVYFINGLIGACSRACARVCHLVLACCARQKCVGCPPVQNLV